jgi:hypothetical protein
MMFNNEYEPNKIENWTCIRKTNKEFEAEMLKSFLLDRGLDCHILSKKDSSYVVDHSALSILYVYVPNESVDEARAAMNELDDAPFADDFPDEEEDDDENKKE